MRGKDPLVGEMQNSSHFLRENHEKSAKKVIFGPPCILFWNMQDGRMVKGSHKYLVLGMRSGPRAELWAHLR